MAANNITNKNVLIPVLRLIAIMIGAATAFVTVVHFAIISDESKKAAMQWLQDALHTSEVLAFWGIAGVLCLITALLTGFSFYLEKKETANEAKSAENPDYVPTVLTPYNGFLRFVLGTLRLRFLDRKQAYFAPLIQTQSAKKYQDKKTYLAKLLSEKSYIFPTQFTCLNFEKDNNCKNLHALFMKRLLQTSKPILILADSGIGKTTFLQKLYCDYAKTYPNVSLAFVYAGFETLKEIQAIRNKANTILFLDAFDEDTNARENLSAYIHEKSELMVALSQFQQVIVTCRQQFLLPKKDEKEGGLAINWTHLGEDEFLIIKLHVFTDTQAKQYLTQKYGEETIEVEGKLEKKVVLANRIFDKAKSANGDSFFQKALLLSYMDDFLNAKKANIHYLCDIYRHIIEKQAKEHEQLEDRSEESYETKLLTYSQKIALFEYEKNKKQLSLQEIQDLAEKLDLEAALTKIDARSRSFLTKAPYQRYFTFSHSSFFDYFLALSLFEQVIEEEDFTFADYPEVTQFYNEICCLDIALLKVPPIDAETGKILDLGDKNAFLTAFPKLPFIPNRQIAAMIIENKENLQSKNYVYWYEYIKELRDFYADSSIEHSQNETPPNLEKHYIFQDYEDAQKENNTKRPYFQYFGREMEYQKILQEYGTATAEEVNIKGVPNLSFGVLIYLLRDNNKFAHLYQLYKRIYFQNLDIQNLDFCQYLSPDLRSLNLCGNSALVVSTGSTTHASIARFRELRSLHLPLSATTNKVALRAILELPHLQELFFETEKQDLRALREEVIFPPAMVAIEGGTYKMGILPKDETSANFGGSYDLNRERPRHEVQVDSFSLGKYAVTVGEFRRFVMDSGYQQKAQPVPNRGLLKGSYIWQGLGKFEFTEGIDWECDVKGDKQTDDRMPVIHVSWYDAAHYCNWLSEKEGKEKIYEFGEGDFEVIVHKKRKGYRLPTEAEWEYAAREKGKEVLFGNGKNVADATEINFEAETVYGENVIIQKYNGQKYINQGIFRKTTVPVGSLPPNALGLYEMSGNVNEWCQDAFDSNFYITSRKENPFCEKGDKVSINNEYYETRTLRGGSWYVNAIDCRVSSRGRVRASYATNDIGFRVVI